MSPFRFRHHGWLVLLGCAIANLALYAALLETIPRLIPAQRSFAEQVIPAAARYLDGSCLEICAALVPAGVVLLHETAAPRFLLAVLALFAVYVIALYVVANRQSLLLGGIALAGGAACLLLTLISPALLSGDMYSYIIYGRMASIYGGNPYAEIPASYSDDPFFKYVYWTRDPTYYGPLWTLLSSGLVLLGGNQLGLTVLLFRCLAIGAVLVSSTIIWWTLSRAQPSRALQGMVFFLWNPLTVLELGLSAHNDAIMVMLVAVAVWLHVRGRYSMASTALVLSLLSKIVVAPLIALYVLMALRRIGGFRARARFVLVSGILATAAVALTLAAVRIGPEVLTVGSLGVSADRYVNSLHEVVFNVLRRDPEREPQWTDVPLRFKPHWIAAHTATDLWSELEPIGTIGQWSELLAIAPQSGQWVRVYDPTTGTVGYVRAQAMGPVAPPAVPESPELRDLQAGPMASPAAIQANLLIRVVGWAGFGLVWLVAAWQTRDLRRFLVWGIVVELAYLWLAAAWIWPWYVTWALMLAAFVPWTRPAGLTAVLTATVLTLYVSMGFEPAVDDRIFVYRAVPAFALPLMLWGTWWAARWFITHFMRRRIRERPAALSTAGSSGVAAA